MFNWFWKFLYSISKTLFELIDGLMSCANKLCGIESVSYGGEETDFLYYLFKSDAVWDAFRVAALLGMIVLVMFTIFAILRSIVKDKPEGTPAQIVVKAFKSFLMFLFVPAVMIAVMWLGNEFMQALYKATTGGSRDLGDFLFLSFARNGLSEEGISYFSNKINSGAYKSTATVMKYMDLSDFEFIFSWLVGAVILVSLATSMLLFVERVISIIVLYIVAPFSISTSVLDDGAHFKLWRDQIMVKFLMGYGAIIALNVYAMICGLVVNENLVFFEDSTFLNFLMKVLLIGGGAVALKKSMALIGNLVQAGAGSNELRDNELAMGSLRRGISGFGGALATATGISAAKGIVGSAMDSKKRDLGERLLTKMGMSIHDNRARENPGSTSQDGDSDSRNDNRPSFGGSSGENNVKNAISGGGNSGGTAADNKQNEQPKSVGNSMVNNAISGGGKSSNSGNDSGNLIDDDDDVR